MHNQIFDLQPKTYCFGIDIRLLFLVSIARATGMNIRVVQKKTFFFKYKPSPPQIVRLTTETLHNKFQLIRFRRREGHAI